MKVVLIKNLMLILSLMLVTSTIYAGSLLKSAQQVVASKDVSAGCKDKAQPSSSLSEEQLESGEAAFATCLRDAINVGNQRWIAAHVLYPLTVVINGNAEVIHNTKEFLNHYDEIIDGYIKKMAKDDILWKGSRINDGYMIGVGEIWIMSLGPPGDMSSDPMVKFYIVTIRP